MMNNTAFLGRNRGGGGVVQLAPPAASDARSNGGAGVVAIGELQSGFTDAMRGRVSLLFLNSVIVGLVAFYLWTRRAQGGG